MTKKFDAYLLEMMPASLEGGFGPTVDAAKQAVPPKDQPTYHYKALQALEPDIQDQVIASIVKKVFPEKDFTYSASISGREDLKDAIATAIRDTASEIPEFKPGGNTMVRFLADRLANKKLLGNLKYSDDKGGEATPEKEITQKQFKQALDKAVDKADKTGAISDEEADVVGGAKDDMVYAKAADIDSEDDDILKAFNKLPDAKDMTWKEVLGRIGLQAAQKLLDAGALLEEPKGDTDEDPEEGSDIKELEFDDEDDDLDSPDFDKLIDPYFSRTSSPYAEDSY